MLVDPFDVVIGIIKSCKGANDMAVQNKKDCTHLLSILEGIEPSLKSLERESMMVQKQLKGLTDVFEEAKNLIRKQSKSSGFIIQMCFSSSVKGHFADIKGRLFEHMDVLKFG